MARTGYFGRQPRAIPNLQATLLSIAREQERTRDSNLMEAWQKGGMFEGHKATDSIVIKHWKDRLTDISPDDPLYDTYKNAVTQLEYSIAESKMTASYATKHKSDAQMTAFYLHWAKKVPKDSELYRILQRDAGQYMRNVQVRNQADTQAAKERRYNAYMNDLSKGTKAGDAAINLLEAFATKGFVSPDGQYAIPAPTGMGRDGTASGALFNLGSEDADEMLRMVANLVTRPERDSANGAVASDIVLYHDDSGKPVTAQSLGDYFAKHLGNSFDGTIGLDTIQTAIKKSKKTLQQMIEHAEATGHVTDANRFKGQMEGLVQTGRIVDAIPVQEDYNDIIESYNKSISAPGVTAQDILDADKRKTDQLIRLGNDPRIATDDARRSAIIGEANKEEATLTLTESFTQFEDRDGAPTKENAINAQRVEFAQEEADLLNDPESGWMLTPGVRGPDGAFTPKAGGTALGAAPIADIMAAAPAGARTSYAKTAGGAQVPVLVPAQLVTAGALDANGNAVDIKGSANVMRVYALSYGGTQHVAYGVNVNGKEMFASTFPGDPDKAKLLQGSDGEWTMDLSGTLPPFGNPAPYVQYGQPGVDDYGNEVPPSIQIDPAAALAASEPSIDGIGGYDPHIMFANLTVAMHMTSEEGRRDLDIIKDIPGFQLSLQYDIDKLTGTERDAETGAVTKQGDVALETRLMGETGDALHVGQTGYASFLDKKDSTWSKAPDTLKPMSSQVHMVDIAAAGWTPQNDRDPKWLNVIPTESRMAPINLGFDPNNPGRLSTPNLNTRAAEEKAPEIRLGKPITIPGVTWTPPAVAGGAVSGNVYAKPVSGSAPAGSKVTAYKPPSTTTRERL
jgi:hypothetical protein